MSPQNNGTEPNGEHHGSNGITLEKRNAADANGKTATPENGVNGITHTAVGIIEDDKDSAPRKLCCGGGKDGKPLEERVSFFNLFRFATVFDKFLMIVGSLAMFIVGAGLPMNLYFFGELLTSFILIDASKNMPPTSANNVTTAVNNITSTLDPLNSNSLRTKCAAKYQESISAEPLDPQALQIKLETVYVPAFVSIGVLALALYYIGMTFWKWTAERQITKIRITFFQAIIRQSVGWFDVTDTGALNTRLVEDIDRIQDGVGDKIATFIQWLATFIGGFGIGFVSGPKLAGVIVCASPLMVIIGAAFSRFIRTLVKKELVAYSKAGSIAEETFAAIRTVAAFGGEEKAEEKYGHNLKDATKEGVRKSTMAGLMVGIFWTVIFSIFALAFWYGAKLVREECLPPGTILQVVFGVLIGAMSLGNAVPLIENFGNARGGAAAIYKIIDTHTEIDSHSEEGIKPENVEGNVDFCDVEFSYPARPELKILNKLNLSVSKGQTIALVGESGCGKSTTVHLLQRFYECAAGSVKVDGRDIRDYNLRWLRDHMGIVGQEPVLFAESILQNIKLGGRTQASEDVTPQQIEDACKMANCYDFIKKLPQGFDTLVGERGIQLSGGQKQRIAIARALVRNPTILLLDEATSALDTQSEKIVQDALNKASEGRTTIVIAHRLSTVKNADRIYAFRSGVVNESGTHDELMKKGGVYYSLCMRQMKQEEEEKTQLQADITGINNIKGGHPETPAHEPKQNNEEDAISHSSETLAVVSLDDYLVKRDHSLRRSSHHRASTRSARSILGVETPDANKARDSGQVDTLLSGVVTSDEEVEIKPDTKTADISYLDILSMNKPEWYYIVFGVLGALVVGSIQPMFALVMSEIIGRLSIDDLVRQERETSEVIAYILGVGLGAALSSLIMQFFLSMSGEKLTERLRKKTFHQLCRQEIGYFDSEENGVGVLMTRLSADASLVKGATGLRIGVITQTLTIIIASLIIAFLAVWQLTLVMVIFMPISIVAGAVQVKAMRGYAEGDQKAIEIGSKMAQEVISNIRTVTSLNRQTHFYDNYANHFNNLYRESRTRIFTSGITYAIANSMVYFLYGVNFGYGGWLVLNIPDLEFFLIFRVFACVQFGGMAIGRASANLPDYARAKLAAAKIKELFQRESLIDHTSQSGEKLESCDGVVEFSKVAFRYPSRPNVKVLRGLTVKINKGETLALVGSSGCGKSTSVSLLERFYDPVSGSVCLSGVPTTDLNVRSLRQQLGLVSQEPTLFDVSIRENIEYGDNSRSVSMDEVIDAAKQANIHNFITTLPNGYETEVGSHGTQLSGGQKQRIAIARALVRNPSVLLLDEATSALDTESEKVVQEALERAQQGRTSIIIAHRLTTVKNADKIALIDQGKVAEIGTHSQLIAMKGQYYNLINAQL